MSKDDRKPVAAGDTRSRFGHALDQLLPLPERRRSFRRWRHTRPFWAGVFAVAGGIVLISYPLGPLPAMMAIGSAAFTGIAIGLIMVIGGFFFLFAPQQRTFVAIVVMICSVLSLVASNLGGFLLGMVLGMLGAAMAFGWQPGGDYLRRGAPEPAAAEAQRPSPVPRDGDGGSNGGSNGKAAGSTSALVVVAGLLAASGLVGWQAAPAEATAQQGGLPTAACGKTLVRTDSLDARNLTIVGTVQLPTKCGSVRVTRLRVEYAELDNYRLASPDGRYRGGIVTDLVIRDTDIYTPYVSANINLIGLVPGLEGLPGIPVGPVPITPRLVGTLESLGVLPLTLPSFSARPASLEQPLITSQVELHDFRLYATTDDGDLPVQP